MFSGCKGNCMWKTLAVGCFFFWLVYSTIYFFANKQELLRRDLEHSIDDAKSRVSVLKNEILDLSYETDLLLRFQKENRRLLTELKRVVKTGNTNSPDEENTGKDSEDKLILGDDVKEICKKEQEELREKLLTESHVTVNWLEEKIKAWESEKVRICEKERWEIYKRQQEGTWSTGNFYTSQQD